MCSFLYKIFVAMVQFMYKKYVYFAKIAKIQDKAMVKIIVLKNVLIQLENIFKSDVKQ